MSPRRFDFNLRRYVEEGRDVYTKKQRRAFQRLGARALNGATDKEIAEVAFLASYTSRWSAMLHALQYDYDTFNKEVHQIGEYAKKASKKK